MQDVPLLEPGEDLHTYMLRFENLYCANLDDRTKIYKLTNKLIWVLEIYKKALSMENYTNWVRFRNKLLRDEGKKPKEVM